MVVTSGSALMFVGGYGRSDAGDWTAMTDVWMADGEAMTAVASLPMPWARAWALIWAGGRIW